jgi:Ribosomal protein L13E
VEYRATVIEPSRALVRKPRLVKYGKVNLGLRAGRGFSLGELEAVGLDVSTARKLGLYVDVRRRSVRQENVELLKNFLREMGLEA